MVTPTSRLAYNDCFDLMDRALGNKRGIRFPTSDIGAARHFRLRLHAARSVDRKDNYKEFPDDHPLHGRSVYDPLVVRIEHDKGKVWIKIEKTSIDALEIETLGEAEDVINEAVNGDSGEAERDKPSQSGEGQSETSRAEGPWPSTEEGEEIQDAEEVKKALARRI